MTIHQHLIFRSHEPIRDCSRSEASWLGWGVLAALVVIVLVAGGWL